MQNPGGHSIWRDEDEMVSAISQLYPKTDQQTLRMHRSGWDSVAIESAGRLFKFPREEVALAALRREVAILALVRPISPLPVPHIRLHENPKPFSEHPIVPGEHLLADQYETLTDVRRQRLAFALAQFYAAIHAIDPIDAKAVGAVAVEAWLSPDAVSEIALPLLPDVTTPAARKIIADYAWGLGAADDDIYGFFDGHGWNMAFDHSTGTLNGIYDFADSGIGSRHQEFVYSSFISWDLTERIIGNYEVLTGRQIDRNWVRTLTGYHRLWELAVGAESGEAVEDLRNSVLGWVSQLNSWRLSL